MKALDVRALVLINSRDGVTAEHVALAGPPLALLDVAGKSPLLRAVEHLEQSGISSITAVVETGPCVVPRRGQLPSRIDCRASTPEFLWPTCESVLHDLVESGADVVLIIRLGAYAEVDYGQLVQFHRQRSCLVSHVVHDTYVPEVFCFSASQRSDTAASLFRSGLSKYRGECPGFPHSGYINPLQDARDLRQLALDVLTLKTKTRPAGEVVRPGVWIGPAGVAERGARILAPAFIGASARIRDGAVITRGSTIEHHAHVDRGTVVENSTVLPHSYIGPGLDLAHSVVGMGQIANLRLGTTIRVQDRRLVGHVSSGLRQKLLRAATEVLTLLSRRIRRAIAREDRARKLGLGTGEGQPPRLTADEHACPEPAPDVKTTTQPPSPQAEARGLGE